MEADVRNPGSRVSALSNGARLTLGVVLALLILNLAVASPHHRHRRHSPKSARQLQADLANVRGRKAQLRAELRSTRKKVHTVAADLHTVDSKLDDVKSRLCSTRAHLASERREQRTVAAELESANKELDKTREQVRRRLRQIYIRGHASDFSAVIGTQSAGELASRGALMEAIERSDRELFNRYTRLQKETEAHKRRQDAIVQEVAALAGQEQSETRELADVRAEKGEVLEGLRARQGELQDEIRQFEADEAEIRSQIEAYARMHSGSRRRGRQLAPFTGRFSRPIDAPITSGFGMRYHPILHIVRMHTGIDFGAPIGTPIHAAADGDVIATTYMRGYGHVVILDHGGGISTVYAHTSAVYCSPGQHVLRGQTIAAVGNSGLSTGPHLHFEVRVGGQPVNPLHRL
jgi:murein DD-endopeptidase MepM/ murein hydrolase activator NlpD